MVGEEWRVDVLCSRTSYDNEPCRDPPPPGVLECDELACWIILTGIKILFVIETQTSAEPLNSGKR